MINISTYILTCHRSGWAGHRRVPVGMLPASGRRYRLPIGTAFWLLTVGSKLGYFSGKSSMAMILSHRHCVMCLGMHHCLQVLMPKSRRSGLCIVYLWATSYAALTGFSCCVSVAGRSSICEAGGFGHQGRNFVHGSSNAISKWPFVCKHYPIQYNRDIQSLRHRLNFSSFSMCQEAGTNPLLWVQNFTSATWLFALCSSHAAC